jgi:sugar phosphate isomerase/epimerase
MNRRDVLKAAGSAACVWSAGSVSAAQPKKPRWKSAIGLNGFESASNKYGKKFAIWDVLDFASRAGFDGVELVPTWPAPMSAYPAPDDARAIRALRRLYEGFGLQVFSIQTYGAGAYDPDPKVRRNWLDGWRRNARFAKAVGADCIGIWPGGPLGNQTEAQAVDHLAESFREVWKCAGELGLTASCEIEPPFVFHSEEHMKQILAKAPGSRVNVDFAHFDMFSGGRGRIADLIRRIGVKNVGYVHLTDCDGTLRDGGTSKHLPCGQGHIDIAAALATLRQGGYEGWIMIDAWETPDPYEANIQGKKAIDRAMAGG